jgi:Protein of unknown function (DUF2909)
MPTFAIAVFLIAILAALFSGMFFLLKDRTDSRRMLKALTWRVGLQLALIVFLALAYGMGWIHPHAIIPNP